MQEQKKFYWKGIDQQGKTFNGYLTLNSETELKQYLLKSGIALLKFEEQKTKNYTFFKNKVLPSELIYFFSSLSVFLSSGVSLINSLELVNAKFFSKKLHIAIKGMIGSLKRGLSFQNSLNKYKNIFSPIMVETVRIGEASGDLETVFFRLANYLSWKESFKKKLKQSLLLPFLTLGIGLVLMSVIFVFVIPQFEIILKSLDKPLPKLTLLTFAIANNFMPAVIIVSLLTFFSFIIFRFYVDSKYKIQLDKFLFNLPVVGQLLHKLDLVRFVYALSLQLRCGVPLIESINNSKQNVRSLFFKNKFLDLIKLVQRGNSLEEALSLIGSTYFPKELIAIIAVGERSGKLIEMLDRAVFIFEEELNRVFETLTIIVQPCLIVLVGLIIGVLMIAVYMPIFAIGTGL